MRLTDDLAARFAGALSVLMSDLPDEIPESQRCDCHRHRLACTYEVTGFHGGVR
jgi:hypothetical protein